MPLVERLKKLDFVSVFLACGFGLLALFILARVLFGSPLPTPELEVATNPRRADFSWPLKDLEGNATTLEEWLGDVIVLNVWATWCAPCRVEMPGLQALHDTVSGDGIVVLAVSVDAQVEKPRDFADKHGLTLNIRHSSIQTPSVFQSQGIPATFIIDRKGNVVTKHVGAASWDDVKVVEFLRGL